MKTNEKKNTSAKKKLIPAVAMLTTSAVMLSTATYAWFTLNKTVEVDGLKMTATAADALEISLGGVTNTTRVRNGGTLADNLAVQPKDTDDELSWTSVINVGEYYDKVAYIKPSSSVNGINFFEATDPDNGGRTATKFTTATNDSLLTKRSKLDVEGTLKNDEETNKGFYVDVPVHLRTSKLKDGTTTSSDVFCKMLITDPKTGENMPEGDLYKAVRVAIIPLTAEGTLDTSSKIILGADDGYYNAGQAVASTSDTTRSSVTVKKTNSAIAQDGTQTLVSFDTTVDIPLATKSGTYGHTDFVVRVWLEGESTSCFDANSAQDWNIDFVFALDKNESSFTSWNGPATGTGV